jgi:hypothetical protein
MTSNVNIPFFSVIAHEITLHNLLSPGNVGFCAPHIMIEKKACIIDIIGSLLEKFITGQKPNLGWPYWFIIP